MMVFVVSFEVPLGVNQNFKEHIRDVYTELVELVELMGLQKEIKPSLVTDLEFTVFGDELMYDQMQVFIVNTSSAHYYKGVGESTSVDEILAIIYESASDELKCKLQMGTQINTDIDYGSGIGVLSVEI